MDDATGEINEAILNWQCSQCEKKKAGQIGEYTWKIFRLRRLRLGGYPLAANDLSMEEWLDLGRAEEFLRHQEQVAASAETMMMMTPRGL